MNEVEGVESVLTAYKNVDLDSIANYDSILVGSPNHVGNATRGIRKFVDKLGKLDLAGKHTAVFDTYQGKDFEKAMKKLEKRITDKVPDLNLIISGLSIRVDGMKGPISDGELPKCTEFGITLIKQLKSE